MKLLAGRYRVGVRIGEGAFADVYEAVDTNSGELVALKLLKMALTGRHGLEARRRFLREAELVGSLSHPDIVGVYDIGATSDGRLFMVLERLHGSTLEEHIDRHGGMDVEQAVNLLIGALEALDVAHAAGMVHRDLKPSNLFIERRDDEPERLRILDFGLAYVRDFVGSRVSQRGQINGTAAYLAPEYVEKEEVTPQIDVYQMGLIFAEMVAGLPAVRSTSPMGCLARHMAGELELPLETLGPNYGGALRRAVAKDPRDRYLNAGEFRDGLIEASGAPANTFPSATSYEVQVLDPTSSEELEAISAEMPSPMATRPTRVAPAPTRRVASLVELLAADREDG